MIVMQFNSLIAADFIFPSFHVRPQESERRVHADDDIDTKSTGGVITKLYVRVELKSE